MPSNPQNEGGTWVGGSGITDRIRISLARDHPIGQFLRFGVVGTIGFVVDTAVLYLALWLGAGFYGGRVISYLVAASGNWALNRAFTFPSSRDDHAHRQWVKFLVLNVFGAIANYGAYAALIGVGEPFRTYPVLAVAAGSLAGLVFNFTLSKRFVFSRAE